MCLALDAKNSYVCTRLASSNSCLSNQLISTNQDREKKNQSKSIPSTCVVGSIGLASSKPTSSEPHWSFNQNNQNEKSYSSLVMIITKLTCRNVN